jgi:hypothetical protein
MRRLLSLSSWDARPLLVIAAGTLAIIAVAGCSSGEPSKPAGLNGTETGVSPNSVYARENAAAASSLPPAAGSFLAGKSTVSLLGATTPVNGDINPYAIWPVTQTVGSVRAGDVLVDNFNNASNDQGTGTTIVDVHPGGHLTVFAQIPKNLSNCPGGVGLTTAMVQLKTGWVIVGSLPSATGQIATAGDGCLIVLSPDGAVAGTISGPYLDGPWDAAISDNGGTAALFVANTLFGISKSSRDGADVDKGDVVRLTLSQTATSPPKVTAETVVGSGFPERPDASAFVKGPTGLALSASGTLYVANNPGNAIDVIPNAVTRTSSAGTGSVLTSGGQLANPLGMAVAPDGDLIAANATNGKIVEVTQAGKQAGEFYADDGIGQEPPGNGDLFDVAIDQAGTGVLFVNDGTNVLQLLHR